MDGETLADKIRTKLSSGRLPRNSPAKARVGYGRERPCHGCGEIILPAQIQYELEMKTGLAFRMHIGCRGLWEAELRRRGWWSRVD